jgi:hypothetical protein
MTVVAMRLDRVLPGPARQHRAGRARQPRSLAFGQEPGRPVTGWQAPGHADALAQVRLTRQRHDGELRFVPDGLPAPAGLSLAFGGLAAGLGAEPVILADLRQRGPDEVAPPQTGPWSPGRRGYRTSQGHPGRAACPPLGPRGMPSLRRSCIGLVDAQERRRPCQGHPAIHPAAPALRHPLRLRPSSDAKFLA